MGVRPSSFKHATHGHHHISLYLEAYLKGLLALSVTGKGILDLVVWGLGDGALINRDVTCVGS